MLYYNNFIIYAVNSNSEQNNYKIELSNIITATKIKKYEAERIFYFNRVPIYSAVTKNNIWNTSTYIFNNNAG